MRTLLSSAACALVLTASTMVADPRLEATEGSGPKAPRTAGAQRVPLDSVAALHAWAKESASGSSSGPVPSDLPQAYRDLDYDGYRAIRAVKDERLWRDTDVRFQVEPLPLGGRYRVPVRASAIDSVGETWAYGLNAKSFDLPEGLKPLPDGAGFGGLRFLSPERQPDVFDEFLVFHGASYFRAVGRHHGFGTSARGLAIDTAQPTGEEFPTFTRFLIEEPEPGARTLVIHALIESESAVGVFKFMATPGLETSIDVDAVVYPRRELSHVGVAPLTSMFLFAPRRGRKMDDFRGAVYDAGGLAMITGSGERLWRPLGNPKALQVSAFSDQSPKGFGLIQRNRDTRAFGDIEARYEKRPSVWVEPLDDWGKGAVVLVEIPTETEFNDNIVAFWRPETPLAAEEPARFRYRLRFADGAPDGANLARVMCTGEGRVVGSPEKSTERVFAVDFSEPKWLQGSDLQGLTLDAWASAGSLVETRLEHGLPGQVRAILRFEPGDDVRLADLSVALRRKGSDQAAEGAPGDIVSERWMTRWER